MNKLKVTFKRTGRDNHVQATATREGSHFTIEGVGWTWHEALSHLCELCQAYPNHPLLRANWQKP